MDIFMNGMSGVETASKMRQIDSHVILIFLTASAEVRAERRCKELAERGTPQDYDSVLKDMLRRDELDCSRAVAPLKQAEDAVLLDTSEMDFDESAAALLHLIEEKINEA